MTRKSDPDSWYDPDEEVPDTTVRDLVKAYARIAELEAERDGHAADADYWMKRATRDLP